MIGDYLAVDFRDGSGVQTAIGTMIDSPPSRPNFLRLAFEDGSTLTIDPLSIVRWNYFA
jgi:hypothetical protein